MMRCYWLALVIFTSSCSCLIELHHECLRKKELSIQARSCPAPRYDRYALGVLVHASWSPLSGLVTVADTEAPGDGRVHRTLAFGTSRGYVQSSARMIQGHDCRLVVDADYLENVYEKPMVEGLVLIDGFPESLEKGLSAFVIGLGGGRLVSYINKHFPEISILVAELDPHVVYIAKKYFAFEENNNLTLVVNDGIKVAENAAKLGLHFDAIIIDVDSKDSDVVPGKLFMDLATLQMISQILHPNGVFMMNIILKDDANRSRALSKLKKVFPQSFMKEVDGYYNEIFFAKSPQSQRKIDIHAMPQELKNLKKL